MLKLLLHHKHQHQYAPVGNESEEQIEKTPPLKSSKRAFALNCLLVFIVASIMSGVPCFFAGKTLMKQQIDQDWLSPPGKIDHTFNYRWEFSAIPSDPESQKWWKKIFPRGRGFVQHPEISPEPRGVSVFHQLHCLDALRRGYYTAVTGVNFLHAQPNNHSAEAHVRHCIDYLRQSIMCNADTNLEPIDLEKGGVTGFGFSRKCRDIVRVIAWADKWRTHDQTDITR